MRHFEFMVEYKDHEEKKGIFYAYDKNAMLQELNYRRERGIIKEYNVYSIEYICIL